MTINKYKTLNKLKEEFGDGLETYLYNVDIELMDKFSKLREYLLDAISRSWEADEQCYESVLEEMDRIFGDNYEDS